LRSHAAAAVAILPDWPYFDAPEANRGYPGSQLDGFVQIPGGDQDEPANLLFGLREWAVHNRYFASPRPDRSGRANGLKRLISQQVTAVPKRIVIGLAFVDQRFEFLLGQSVQLLFVEKNHAQVFHGVLLIAQMMLYSFVDRSGTQEIDIRRSGEKN
jgi:hypothetical protein